eukprot:TRINITY_DN23036_c0_g1_i11.p3 TRINITY_DN23036_c0_g1~~TRINITY_DN23036_c0_g1_i11.p3  ORF type:complete len:101 (+),score=7.28 TRINITY_DN23036_c0_g1_i11:689-991(+)
MAPQFAAIVLLGFTHIQMQVFFVLHVNKDGVNLLFHRLIVHNVLLEPFKLLLVNLNVLNAAEDFMLLIMDFLFVINVRLDFTAYSMPTTARNAIMGRMLQ